MSVQTEELVAELGKRGIDQNEAREILAKVVPVPVVTTDKTSSSIKRLNIAMSERAYSELLQASKETRRSMTELVRLALGIVKILLEVEQKGEKLLIATSEGHAVREILLPR
jgi:hypothetical protein